MTPTSKWLTNSRRVGIAWTMAVAGVLASTSLTPSRAAAEMSSEVLLLQAKHCNDTQQFAKAEALARQALQMDIGKPRRKGGTVESDSIPELDDRGELGKALFNQRKTDEAFRIYQEAIDRSEQIGTRYDTATLRNNMGETLRQLGKTAEAEAQFKAGLKDISGDVEHDIRYGELLHNLAILQLQLGRYNDALQSARAAVQISHERNSRQPTDKNDFRKLKTDGGGPADEIEGRAECFVAAVQLDMGDVPGAAATYHKIKDNYFTDSIALSAPDVIGQAEITEGKRLNVMRRTAEAAEHFTAAIKAMKEDANDPQAGDTIDQRRLVALYLEAVTNAGSAAADAGKFDEAQAAHKLAFDEARKKLSTETEADAALQLAEDYLMQGKTEQALRLLKDAVKDLGDSPSMEKYRANLDIELAKCYKQLGQKDPAVRLVQEAISHYHNSNNPVSEALACNIIATIYLDFHDLDKFDELQQSMQKLQEFIKDPEERARLEYNRGQALSMRKKYPEAAAQFTKAKELAADTVDATLKTTINNGLGITLYESGDYQRSLDCFKEALTQSTGTNSLDILWSCNLGMGKALKKLQHYDEAEPYLKKAVDLVEQERATLTRDAFKTSILDFRRDCFYELVDLEYLKNKPFDALEVAERGRARTFQDMLLDKRQRRVDVIDESPLKAQTQSKAPVPVAMGGNAGNRGISVNARDDEPEETVESTQTVSPPTLDEIKSAVVKRGSTCVEYLRIQDNFYVWVIKPDGSIKMLPPISGAEGVRGLVRDLNENMIKSASLPEELNKINFDRQKKLAKLYDVLIKPIEQYLPADKNADVTIIPDGFLFQIPFAALVDANGRFFIERHTLSYAPAIGVLKYTQQRSAGNAGGGHKLLAFGNPIIKAIAFLGALPYAEKEVNKIAKLYDPANVLVKTGESATKSAFFKLAPEYTEIHLATHGLVNEEHPMKSALVLAPEGKDDGLLMAGQIMHDNNLKNAKLVVLSACETGKGQITGDGVVGLSRAFILAGTPSVLVSQWNVDDVMTEFQMGKFYDAYLKGKDKATALRDAQLATIGFMENSTPGADAKPDPAKPRANPRYWAAFQLIGETK